MAITPVQGKQIATASWAINAISSSYSQTASFAINALTASYLEGYISPFPYTGSAVITGSLEVIGPSTLYGLQTISSSTDLSALDIHVKDDILWTFRTYNDSYSTSSVGLASWIDNSGVSYLGTETERPLYLYNNAQYNSPTLILSSSGVTVGVGGITGSLFGTASYALSSSQAQNSVSSSFAQTASFAPAYLPLTGGTINGDVNVNGTASIAFLNVTIESASVIYSSGSNQFGDATNDTQTLIGTVIVSGSQRITGSLNVTQGITGSLFGTSSWANNAISSSYALSSSFAVSSSRAVTSSFAISASWAPLNAGGSNTQIQFNSGSALRGTGSFTFNYQSQSLQQGLNIVASGLYSHAQGTLVTASGNYSHAEGDRTIASEQFSHAEGVLSVASGYGSHAEGVQTVAQGNYSHAEGVQTVAQGNYSHAEGSYTTASGDYSHAEGEGVSTSGNSSHGEGKSTQAIGYASHAEGNSAFTGIKTAFIVGKNAIEDGTIIPDSDQDLTSYFTPGQYLYLYDGFLFTSVYGWASFLIDTVTWDGSKTIIQLVDTSVNTQQAYIGGIDYLLNNGTFGGTQGIPGDYAHAEGTNTFAIGPGSHTEGIGAKALGSGSHAEGSLTLAQGNYSHAEGNQTQAIGPSSHAEGLSTQAIGNLSHAEGRGTQTLGAASHAEGQNTIASGSYSHAEGWNTIASGSYAHAEGSGTVSIGNYSHTEGYLSKTGIQTAFTTRQGDGVSLGLIRIADSYGNVTNNFTPGGYLYLYDEPFDGTYGRATYLIDTVDWNGTNTGIQLVDTGIVTDTAYVGDLTYLKDNQTFGGDQTIPGPYSHAEGSSTQAIGKYAHSEGSSTQAVGDYSHAEGQSTIASGFYSHTEGLSNQAIGNYSHAEGQSTIAVREGSHAEGSNTTASGDFSHAEGGNTYTINDYAHAEGFSTVASGQASHAEGSTTHATNDYAHAEGINTVASGISSHAEGTGTQATGDYSHAEGFNTISSGSYSHAEGLRSIASGESSHAEGDGTQAIGQGSHSEGLGTIALGDFQHVQGQFNISSSAQSAFIIGNGINDSNRSNLVFTSGSTFQITGSLLVSGSITGSLFGTASYATQALSASWAPTQTINTGSFVTTSSFNNFTSSYNTGSFTGSFTGSLFGTASWATNVISASYAATASSALNASDILIYVKNVTGAQINKGVVVRISGATGDNPLISTASYESDGVSANTLGITYQNIPNDSFGYVMTEGTLLGINTNDFTAGQLLYLGPTGSIIGTAPLAPLHSVRLGQVLRVQQNNGSMYVRIDNGYELGELHDVLDNSTTSSYGDLLVKSGSVWINSKQLTGSYGLTGSLTATSFTGSLFGTASWASNAINAQSASYVLQAISSSFASTASFAPNYVLTSVTSSMSVATASFAQSGNGAFSGSFSGSGANLNSIPSTAIVGLNLSQIAASSVTASVNAAQFSVVSASVAEFTVTGTGVTIGNTITDTHRVTGSLNISGSVTAINFTGSLFGTASFAATASFALNAGGGGTSLGLVQAFSVGLQNIF